MPPIPTNIAAHVGRTPMVQLTRMLDDPQAELFAKLEALNPGGSVKDRIGVSMIEAAERDGLIEPGRTTVVEATSGNTGIALAFVCAAKGYDLVLTMPQGMSREREGLLRLYGARVEITESLGGMNEAVDAARAMASRDDVFLPDQFSNPANPEIHRQTTGPEIWEATDGRVDVFVAGVGTGGHDHRRRRVPQGPQSRLPDRRGRAELVAGPVGRTARPAQDPGNRRGLRPRGPQPRRDRRGDRSRRRGRDRDRATAVAARGGAVGDLVRSGGLGGARARAPPGAPRSSDRRRSSPDSGERYVSTPFFAP